MDEQLLKKVIEEGETSTVEFKSWVKASSLKEIINLAVDELIAFANCKGGTVYIGIEDNGKVTGCTGKYDLQNICETIYDKTRPQCLQKQKNYHMKKRLLLLFLLNQMEKFMQQQMEDA